MEQEKVFRENGQLMGVYKWNSNKTATKLIKYKKNK
jgi:hypothetical protein